VNANGASFADLTPATRRDFDDDRDFDRFPRRRFVRRRPGFRRRPRFDDRSDDFSGTAEEEVE